MESSEDEKVAQVEDDALLMDQSWDELAPASERWSTTLVQPCVLSDVLGCWEKEEPLPPGALDVAEYFFNGTAQFQQQLHKLPDNCNVEFEVRGTTRNKAAFDCLEQTLRGIGRRYTNVARTYIMHNVIVRGVTRGGAAEQAQIKMPLSGTPLRINLGSEPISAAISVEYDLQLTQDTLARRATFRSLRSVLRTEVCQPFQNGTLSVMLGRNTDTGVLLWEVDITVPRQPLVTARELVDELCRLALAMQRRL